MPGCGKTGQIQLQVTFLNSSVPSVSSCSLCLVVAAGHATAFRRSLQDREISDELF